MPFWLRIIIYALTLFLGIAALGVHGGMQWALLFLAMAVGTGIALVPLPLGRGSLLGTAWTLNLLLVAHYGLESQGVFWANTGLMCSLLFVELITYVRQHAALQRKSATNAY